MRNKLELINKPLQEDIVAYEHHIISNMVRVYVGVGYEVDGIFTPSPAQTFEPHEIVDVDYEELMAGTETRPAGVFRKDDLWPFVDKCRAGKDCRTLQMLRVNGLQTK